MDTVVEDLHDVRTAKRRSGLSLEQEPRTQGLGAGHRTQHQFHRDGGLEHQVLGAPDRAHTPAAKLVIEPVLFGEHVAGRPLACDHEASKPSFPTERQQARWAFSHEGTIRWISAEGRPPLGEIIEQPRALE